VSPRTPADAATPPWQIPPSALGTQRLYRVSYDSGDGGGSFRLSLRVASPERYQVRAVDPVGRSLWTLEVAGEEGLWLDHRAGAACRLAGRLDVAAGQLTPFPLAAVPALLLGRLPEAPAGPVEAIGDEDSAVVNAEPAAREPRGGRIAYHDALGRRWVAVLEDGVPRSWSMSEREGQAPGLWWLRRGGEAVLSDRVRGVQLRWRESLTEPLGGGLAAPAVPADFTEVPCETLYPRAI
jgi:hypothetical protein